MRSSLAMSEERDGVVEKACVAELGAVIYLDATVGQLTREDARSAAPRERENILVNGGRMSQ